MSLLASVFRKTTRKRSRSDADTIQSQQWGAPLSQTITSSTMRSRARPSVDRFDSSSTVVEKAPAARCQCCTCDFDMRKLRVRDKTATIRIGIRYALMFAHTSFQIATLIVALYRRDIILIGMCAALTIAYLIYVPAAFALSLAKAGSRFDHVAGEIAYLSVQIAGCLGAGLYPTILLSLTDCKETWDNVNWDAGQVIGGKPFTNQAWCESLMTSAGLGFGHAATLMLWLAYIIIMAFMTSQFGRALQISTGWLLSGWEISPAERAKPR